MTIVAGMADFRQSDPAFYVRYRFCLDAAKVCEDLGEHDQNVNLIEASRLLRSRAIAAYRAEECDQMMELEFERLGHAAEILLVSAGFDFEFMDGYTIYWKA
jgi:hypothetical protein